MRGREDLYSEENNRYSGGFELVVVKWWGHACFEIRDSKTIVTDPHDGKSVGMAAPKVKANIVLVSHGHSDHASGKTIVAKPDAKIIDRTGAFEVEGVVIKGVPTFHDDSHGRMRGRNVVFVFELEGIRFAHLGDLGHVLSDREVNEIKPVDILMIPVGGYYTIDAEDADRMVEKVEPRIVIPMHYKVKGLRYPISGVDVFLKDKTKVKRLGKSMTTYSKEELPEKTEINVFSL